MHCSFHGNDDDDDGNNDDGEVVNEDPILLTITQFLSITGTSDREVARRYLEMSDDYSLETAVNLFWVNENNNNTNDPPLLTSLVEEEDKGGSSSSSSLMNDITDEPDYEYLITNPEEEGKGGEMSHTNEEEEEQTFLYPTYEEDCCYNDDDDDNNNISDDEEKMVDSSSPDYDYLGVDSLYYYITDDDGKKEEEEEDAQPKEVGEDGMKDGQYYLDRNEHSSVPENNNNDDDGIDGIYPTKGNKVDMKSITTSPSDEDNDDEEDCSEDFMIEEEYILGTMMVRVLQARHVKSNPFHEGGNLISNLLSNHRRNRHQRITPSPASGGGYGTPNNTSYSGNNQHLYATLSYRDQAQVTSMAMEHNGNGDYYWSRSDQSYFDVTCPAFPLKMNTNNVIPPKSPSKAKSTSTGVSSANNSSSYPYKKNGNGKSYPQKNITYPPSPLLELSLYSKKTSNGQGNNMSNYNIGKKCNSNQKEGGGGCALPDTNEDYLVGKCFINVLRVLCGRTPYFDEWCTIHSDDDYGNDRDYRHHHPSHKNDTAREKTTMAGRVRIVIEYEPTDPPPRPGDVCVFANVYPFVDEMYPIPPFSIRSKTRRVLSSSSSTHKTLVCCPKTYCVEEVVGDHVVLSYQTPVENWKCTFEVHRYLVLCVERHQAAVEKVREQVLDLCDNVVQSPAIDILTKTVSSLPDEGLVHVGTDLVIGSLGLLGRWWENGVEGMIEDVVDGINLDGRHSHFPEDNVVAETVIEENENVVMPTNQLLIQKQSFNPNDNSWNDERKALPGMPCCPITGVPMIEPVVAADGHTYERQAIARWLQTSSRSPLTGEILAHMELVPNYLLLSSLGNEGAKETVDEEISELIDVL